MDEYQVWMLLAVQFMGAAIFFAATAFLIWVAFRVSKSINESGGNLLSKVIGTVFGLGVVWPGYNIANFTDLLNKNASYTLSELKKSGVEISAGAERFISDNGDTLPEYSFFTDPIGAIWWLSVLLIILVGIWGPKNS